MQTFRPNNQPKSLNTRTPIYYTTFNRPGAITLNSCNKLLPFDVNPSLNLPMQHSSAHLYSLPARDTYPTCNTVMILLEYFFNNKYYQTIFQFTPPFRSTMEERKRPADQTPEDPIKTPIRPTIPKSLIQALMIGGPVLTASGDRAANSSPRLRRQSPNLLPLLPNPP